MKHTGNAFVCTVSNASKTMAFVSPVSNPIIKAQACPLHE